MAGEGEFPKTGGDVAFASEANDFYNYPKIIYSGTSQNFSFTPTKTDSDIVIQMKGYFTSTGVTSPNKTWTLVISGAGVAEETIDTTLFRDGRGGLSAGNMKMPMSLLGYKDNISGLTAGSITGTELAGINVLVTERTKE